MSKRPICMHCQQEILPGEPCDFSLSEDGWFHENACPRRSVSARAGALDSSWPLPCIVSKLVEAADILLNEKDYNGDGHEFITFARDEAKQWLIQNHYETNHSRSR